MIDKKIEGLEKELAELKKVKAEQHVTKEVSEAFKPIENLKAGDALRANKYSRYEFPKKDEILIVYSLDVPEIRKVATPYSNSVMRNDFTALQKIEGNLIEFVFDSRYFERVTE